MTAVATEEEDVVEAAADGTEEAPRKWKRTEDQFGSVTDYMAEIEMMYPNAPADLLDALRDTEIFSTEDLVGFFGYKRHTRVFQLYTDLRELAEADQVPHPSAMPNLDATGGYRGARVIRGVMKGRIIHWALQSGRYWWDFVNHRLVKQTKINHGGAPRRS